MARLNKHISESGICSRRDADLLIEQGLVTVNGAQASFTTAVQPGDTVCVRGQPLGGQRKDIYIAFNKPVGITCTSERHVVGNIIDCIGHSERIFPIGRLDKDSDGLILLTSNGDIVNEILRSEYHHEKEYLVTVDHPVTPEFLRGMQGGVPILETVTQACVVVGVGRRQFRIVLTQGLNRQIRRMCAVFDYRVARLQRLRISNIRLGKLPLGQWRDLSADELRGLLPHRFG